VELDQLQHERQEQWELQDMDCQFLLQSLCQLLRERLPSLFYDTTYLTFCEKRFHNEYVKRYLLLPLLVLFLVGSTGFVFANHQTDVLGDSVAAVNPQIPPTSDGPGLLLPDSPLFFLDKMKQQIRVIFALTPEAKAKVYADIAGERMAELRFMLARNNKEGIDIDLAGVTQNLQKAADSLAQAHLLGRDVSFLAIAINDNMKHKQQSFDVLGSSSNQEIASKARAVQESLLSAKVAVENVLPEDRKQTEIADDLHRIVQQETAYIASATQRLTSVRAVLGIQASPSAKQATSK